MESSWAGGESSRISPSRIRTMRSTSRQRTSSSRCSMMMTAAWVSRWIWSISSMACLPVAGSRFARGSSNKKTFTSPIITPARETRCFCPPDSSSGAWSRWRPTPTFSETAATLETISSCGVQAFSRTKAISSATVRPMNCPSGSCSTVPTVLESWKMLVSFASSPQIVRLPLCSPG